MLLRLDDLRRASQPSLFCVRTPELLRDADALLEQLISQGEHAISDHLLNTFHARFGVATGTLSPRFQRGERLTILQALSGGMVRTGVNDRLSLLTVSPPGVGKKILADLAGFLAPLCEVVQPGLLSPAGLGARVEFRGGWRAVPGVVPRTNHGTLVMEDIHRLDRADLNSVQSILMGILEDARVAPAKAAAATYEARVALHFNANPQSILGGSSDETSDPLQRLLELNLPYDLASRIDVVLPIHSGDDAAQAAIEMVLQEQQEQGEPDDNGDPAPLLPPKAAQREEHLVKLLIARLRERFPTVTLGKTRPLLKQLMKDLTLVIRQAAARLSGAALRTFDADGLFRRMANSVRKLLGATARLKGRGHVEPADIEEVWELLQGKLEVIQWITGQSRRLQFLGKRADVVKAARDASDARFHQILAACGGQSVGAEAIAKAVGIDVKVAQRELWDRGFKAAHGLYELPTQLVYAAQQAELLSRGGEVTPTPPSDEEEAQVAEAKPEPAGRPSAADLVPPLPLTYLPLALALAGATTDFAALKEADELLTRLLWQEPAVPLVLPTAGYSLLRHLENFHPLSNREELHGLLTDPDWDARGIFILSLLNRVNWPDLLPSAHLWNGKAPHPPKLARIIAEMARREEQYFQDQAPVREAARQAERERRRKAEEDIIRPFLEAERSVIHR